MLHEKKMTTQSIPASASVDAPSLPSENKIIAIVVIMNITNALIAYRVRNSECQSLRKIDAEDRNQRYLIRSIDGIQIHQDVKPVDIAQVIGCNHENTLFAMLDHNLPHNPYPI